MFQTNGQPVLLDGYGRPFKRQDGAGAPGGIALPTGWMFIARLTGGDNTLWLDRFDEAMRHSRDDARSMDQDAHLMRLKEERIRSVVTLPWELEVPDEKDERQTKIRDAIARQVKGIPFLSRILWGMQEAIWFGRSAVQVEWGWQTDRGLKCMVPVQQYPVRGDSIGHQEDGTPYILVNPAEASRLPPAQIISTVVGMYGLRLTGTWRDRFLMHKHLMEARDPFAPDEAEALYGVGIRSKVFWAHWLKLEWLSNITDFFSRVGMGINVWKYEAGNPAARTAIEQVAKENTDRANIFVPVTADGATKGVQGVERVEVPTSGAQFLRELIEYLDRQIETYVVGQEASSKGSSSGLGNEANADFQQDTKKQIAMIDGAWLAESLTGSPREPSLINQMTWWYCHANRDKLGGDLDFPINWKFKIGSTQSDKQLGAIKTLVGLGVPVKADDARMAAGVSKPASGDETIKPPQQGMPGSPGADQGNPLAAMLGGGAPGGGAEGGAPGGAGAAPGGTEGAPGAEQPGAGPAPEEGGGEDQGGGGPPDPSSLPDSGPGSFLKMLLESKGGDGASQFAREGSLHYDWIVAPGSSETARGKLWKPTPPDSGPSRRQKSKPGTGRQKKQEQGGEQKPAADPVESVKTALAGLDAATMTPEQAQQVKDVIGKMTVAQIKQLKSALRIRGGPATKKAGLTEHAQEQALQRAGQQAPSGRAVHPDVARQDADAKAVEPHLAKGLNASQLMKATGLSRARVQRAVGNLMAAAKAEIDDSGRFKVYREKQGAAGAAPSEATEAPPAAPAEPAPETPAPAQEAAPEAQEPPKAEAPAPEKKQGFQLDQSLKPHARHAMLKLLQHINGANITDEQKEYYKTSAQKVLRVVPEKAAERFVQSVTNATFFASPKEIVGALEPIMVGPQNQAALQRLKEAGGADGLFASTSKMGHLFLDGDRAHAIEGEAKTAHEVYAHEFSHAIDGRPGNKLVDKPEWQQAWQKDIKNGQHLLSKYAQKDAGEGFAEFGRRMYTVGDLEKIEQQFPNAFRFWQQHGLVPEQAPEAPAGATMPEVFGQKIPVPDGHADIRLKPGAEQAAGAAPEAPSATAPESAQPKSEPPAPKSAVPAEKTPLPAPRASRAQVKMSDALKGKEEHLARSVFGASGSARDFASVVGATDDATVKVWQPNGDDSVISVESRSPEYRATRLLHKNADGTYSIENSYINVEMPGFGLGTKVFVQQVEWAAAHGFSTIKAEAAREEGHNGYYTWARLGYDGPIPNDVRRNLPEKYAGAQTVQQLIAMPGGMQWWRSNGNTFDGEFDLKPGSRSRQVLDAYLQEKGIGKPAESAPAAGAAETAEANGAAGPEPSGREGSGEGVAKTPGAAPNGPRIISPRQARQEYDALVSQMSALSPEELRSRFDGMLSRMSAAAADGLASQLGYRLEDTAGNRAALKTQMRDALLARKAQETPADAAESSVPQPAPEVPTAPKPLAPAATAQPQAPEPPAQPRPETPPAAQSATDRGESASAANVRKAQEILRQPETPSAKALQSALPASVSPQGRKIIAAMSALGADQLNTGAPVLTRDLRKLMPPNMQSHEMFDPAMIHLAEEGVIALHRHGHPSILTPQERDALVRDQDGNYYTAANVRQEVLDRAAAGSKEEAGQAARPQSTESGQTPLLKQAVREWGPGMGGGVEPAFGARIGAIAEAVLQNKPIDRTLYNQALRFYQEASEAGPQGNYYVAGSAERLKQAGNVLRAAWGHVSKADQDSIRSGWQRSGMMAGDLSDMIGLSARDKGGSQGVSTTAGGLDPDAWASQMAARGASKNDVADVVDLLKSGDSSERAYGEIKRKSLEGDYPLASSPSAAAQQTPPAQPAPQPAPGAGSKPAAKADPAQAITRRLQAMLRQGTVASGQLDAALVKVGELNDAHLKQVAQALGVPGGASREATLQQIRDRLQGQKPFDPAAHLKTLEDAIRLHGGEGNQASMVAIRKALPGLSRAQQEQVIREAVQRGLISRASLEGRQGITPEEHEAAIHENGERQSFSGQEELLPKVSSSKASSNLKGGASGLAGDSLAQQFRNRANRAERLGDPHSARIYRQQAEAKEQ